MTDPKAEILIHRSEMKATFRWVGVCAVYDLATLEYQRWTGADIMFGGSALLIIGAMLIHMCLIYYLVPFIPFLRKGIFWRTVLMAPVYFYLLFHVVVLVLLIVHGVSTLVSVITG